MSKHMAMHHKKAAKGARAARPLKGAHSKKSTRVKKAVSHQEHFLRKAATERQGLEPVAMEVELVDLAALGQQPESVADAVEVYEVEVVGDAEDAGQSEEPELTLDDND
jgi:hypothetical protein